MNTYKCLILFYSAIGAICCSSSMPSLNHRILELNERFLEVQKNGHWLVMFYAPWCIYCKRLDPIWSHVQQSLHHTHIKVCRMDCTTYPRVCRQFKIHGYPTILFIKGDQKVYQLSGDEGRDDIVHFALRLAGPPIKVVKQQDQLSKLKNDDNIFFFYNGPNDGKLWEHYNKIAEKFHSYSYFYHASKDIADKVFENNLPETCVIVYKEKNTYIFDPSEHLEMELEDKLHGFVNEERFVTFVKFTENNLPIFRQIGKYIVVAVVEENKASQIPDHMLQFRNMVESVIRNNKEKYHKDFQFGWIGSPSIPSYMIMQDIPLPSLLVFNLTSQHHYLPDDDPEYLTPEIISFFLDTVLQQSATARGGDSLFLRLYRIYYTASTSMIMMWKGNPLLTCVLFGLPFGFLCLICYSIFCTGILEADDDENESTEDINHKKKE